MTKHRIWYAVLTAVILFNYILSNSRWALVLLLGICIAPVVFALMQVLAMRSLQIDAAIKKSCYVNRQMELKIKVQRKNAFPLGPVLAEITVGNILYGYTKKVEIWLQPADKKEFYYEYHLDMPDCGSVKLTMESAGCYDLIGLFCWNRKIHSLHEIVVYPEQVRMNTELSRRPETKTAGELYDQQRIGQDVNEVRELRNYTEGDSLKSIHWKLSEKIDKLVVREFGYPSDYSTLILYDLKKKMNGKEIVNSRNNAVVALVTSLSYSLLELNLEHQVGRVQNGQLYSIPVHSTNSYEQMEQYLLTKKIDEDVKAGENLYYFLQSNVNHLYTKIIYITTEYDENAARQLSQYVDLTVITVVQGKQTGYIETHEYSVIAVDADDYTDKVHKIEI